MTDFSSKKFRSDLISVGERIRDLCAAKVPAALGHYTGSQLRMINRIYELTRRSHEGIQLKTLAKVLNITPAATSEMVETLVKRGALERRVDPNDRRAMSLRLAEDLEALFKASVIHLDERLEAFFRTTAPEKRAVAAEILHDLNCYLEQQNQQEHEG